MLNSVWETNSSFRNEIITSSDANEEKWKLTRKYQYKLATTFMPAYAKSIEFYKFIVLNKLKFYNKQQRYQFLHKFENAINKIRKPYLIEWFIILFFYLKYFDYYPLKKVLKRFIKSTFRYE